MLLIILSPVAYLAGAVIMMRTDPNTQTDFRIDRAEAARIASSYAATLGIETQLWTSGVKAETSNDRYFYYHLNRNEDAERVRRLAPETYIRVVFISPDNEESLNLELARDGRPLGYAINPPASREFSDPGEAATRAVAVSAFRALQKQEGLPGAGEPVMSEERKSNGVTRRYTWNLPHDALPGLSPQIVISVLGDRVIAQDLATEFDPAYSKANFVNQQIPAKVALVAYGLMIFVIACYGLYRYIRRSWQKEVPHARSLLLGGVLSLAYIFIALQTQFDIFSLATGSNKPGLYWIILISTFMTFLILGMSMGLAYGSGEGDVREAYPGKLTSLDALLTGRPFSRNVARAVCLGVAFGGWALLLTSLVSLPWVGLPGAGRGLSEHFYSLLLGHSSWLLPLLNPSLGSIQIATLGLLLPLSFLLRRRFRSERLLLGILAMLSLVSALGVFQEQPMPFLAGLLVAGVRTAALLILFFTFDLLTAIVGFAAQALVVFVIYFVSQPVASLERAGITAACVALTFLALEIYFLLRGREYSEDEVRPLYARYLAERLRLEAEVSSAREAQIRLLPQKLPEVSGLNLAAACRPARVVGGDFYDLFALDDRRLAIFMAEGGGHGLGAALTIAFAKGFLMPRITASHTPTEVVCGLQEQLTPMLEEGQELALVYAVIDTSERTLTYARAGQYPQVRISRDGGINGHNGRRKKEVESRPGLQAAEREVRVPLGDATMNCMVHEAVLRLAPGDAVIVATDGVIVGLEADDKESLEEWVLRIASEPRNDTREQLQEALDRALGKRAKRRKITGVEDDLTAIIVRLKPNETAT